MGDTGNPSIENICYWQTIVHDYVYTKVNENMYNLRMFMNAKLLCIAFHYFESQDLKLKVFQLDDLSYAGDNNEEVIKNGFDSDVILEAEMSNRIAVFDKQRNLLKVYTFSSNNDHEHICFEISLNHLVDREPSKLLVANFLLGKIMLMYHSEEYQFQCLIVTEEGDVIQGNELDFPHSYYEIRTEEGAVIGGHELELVLRKSEIETPIFHADGVVVSFKKKILALRQVANRLLFYHKK